MKRRSHACQNQRAKAAPLELCRNCSKCFWIIQAGYCIFQSPRLLQNVPKVRALDGRKLSEHCVRPPKQSCNAKLGRRQSGWSSRPEKPKTTLFSPTERICSFRE